MLPFWQSGRCSCSQCSQCSQCCSLHTMTWLENLCHTCHIVCGPARGAVGTTVASDFLLQSQTSCKNYRHCFNGAVFETSHEISRLDTHCLKCDIWWRIVCVVLTQSSGEQMQPRRSRIPLGGSREGSLWPAPSLVAPLVHWSPDTQKTQLWTGSTATNSCLITEKYSFPLTCFVYLKYQSAGMPNIDFFTDIPILSIFDTDINWHGAISIYAVVELKHYNNIIYLIYCFLMSCWMDGWQM